MTKQELYLFIIENYGRRKCYISDLATTLKISYDDANYLTYFSGYRKGKEESQKTESQFISDIRVNAIYEKCKETSYQKPSIN